jgi:hypothetical protein
MNKLKFLGFILTVSLLAIFALTTCDAPLGMGLPIDWEAPVLTLNPVPDNPLYVRTGTIITGKATDNVGVDRIVFTDITTGKELFPVIRSGDNFTIELKFSPEQNGQTILAQISAYDKMGNCGANSIAVITLYIDIRPPIVNRIEINRTVTRNADLETYAKLIALEESDKYGEKKDNLYKYQNGWFYINAVISEEETKIESLSLNFYDTRERNTLLKSFPVDPGYTYYFPRWTITEEELIYAGQEIWEDYYDGYYYNNERYYYRVVLSVKDKSGNENDIEEIDEEEGYICLWADSDKPKGIIDPSIGAIVSRGTPLPVDLYDDDSLAWAYVGLLTEAQWNGDKPVYTGGTIIDGNTDDEKINWLKDRLTSNGKVYNWNYDKHNTAEEITEIIGSSSGKIDEKTIYIPTGKDDGDYGDYVLFVIAADYKLKPHTGVGPEWTNENIWSGRTKRVQLIDENVPLIVFNTVKNASNPNPCPEENTFPQELYSKGGSEEKYFDIVGYTLRENQSNLNKVTTLRMAWIPYNMPGGPDKHINDVQEALKNSSFAGMPEGVQYWNFVENGTSPDGDLHDTGNDTTITTGKYRKQTFLKTFSVMGDIDDLKPDTNNFTYNGKLENESKLFIFYAKDNMSHEVFRQLRVLGYKEKPALYIYDITNKLDTMPIGIPDPTLSTNINTGADPNTASGGPNTTYYTALNNYNKLLSVITVLQGAYNASVSEAEAFQVYPRGSIVKYWVTAAKKGKIGIANITMKDVTFAQSERHKVLVGSGYTASETFSFCEWYPDVTQRTFLFEATDKLGNVASVQRTFAVTNAARLEKITTTTQNGTYGTGTNITLTANFSSQIYINNGVKPRLNIRYQVVDSADPLNSAKYSYKYDYIECNTTLPTYANPSLSLSFNFPVPANSAGKLETAYDGLGGVDPYIRPIELNGSEIFDYARKESAFIPGYSNKSVTMPNWTTATNTLQGTKSIYLDGVAPKITGTSWGGKTPNSIDNNYYFKTGETVELTITSDKPIRASGASTIQYQIRDSGGTLRPANTTYYSPANTNTNSNTEFFKYLKPGTGNSLVYSLTVNSDNCPYDGEIVNVSLYTAAGGKVEDNAGNIITTTGFTSLLPAATHIYIKKTAPAAPTNAQVQLGGVNLNTAPQYYNTDVNLTIAVSTATGPGGVTWEDGRQYTINNVWNDYTVLVPIGANGTHTLQARYKDRAGNEGASVSKIIEINKIFPKLVSVNATQANSYYKAGANLEFNLNFAETVTITNAANVKITLENRNSSNTANNTIELTANTSTATKDTNNTANNVYIANTSLGASNAYVPIWVNGTQYTAFVVSNTARTFRIHPFGTSTGGGTTVGQDFGANISFTDPSYTPAANSTVTFSWNNISGKEMREGLYISAMTLAGLSDRFGNVGPSGITGSYNITNGAFTGDSSVNDCKNLAAGLRVDAIAPTVNSRTPASATGTVTVSGDKLVKTITLEFSEPVMKGSGLITIRPRGTYAIPPVLEDSGYYIGYTNNGTISGTTTDDGEGLPAKFNAAGTNRTYISSFYDIYNNSNLTAADRQLLTQSNTNNSMSDLTLKQRSQQSAGPYQKTTHGLVEGPGYTGSYTGSAASNSNLSGANSPDLSGTYMVPDTSTKWVLDYQYGITQNIAAVNNIRDTLTKAKWRWQEIDVVATTLSNGDKTVTIPLNESLLKGLQWDVYYQEGTFTDIAGNNAPKSGNFTNNAPNGTNNDYYFTSPGVQQPVVRVNRRSYDGRTANWNSNSVRTYANPADTSSNATNPSTNTAWANDTAVSDTNGWGITDFNTIHYRVESESSAVTTTNIISAQYFQGTTANTGATRGAWGNGNVSAANPNSTVRTDVTWEAQSSNTPGTWVLSNIIRRFRTSNTVQNYTDKTKNGTDELRKLNEGIRMFRSYNRDLTKAQLGFPNTAATETLTASTLSNGQGVIRYTASATTYAPLEASKSYVVGTASLNGQSLKGVEGVYRTVIMLAYENNRGSSNFIAVEGSNVKNGMPSIASFPVRDAEDTGDNRYIKVFYHDNVNGTARRSYYWVSTEIVCEWYFLSWGGGDSNTYNGTHQSTGDVNNYMMIGYGDLTYGYNVTRSGGRGGTAAVNN